MSHHCTSVYSKCRGEFGAEVGLVLPFFDFHHPDSVSGNGKRIDSTFYLGLNLVHGVAQGGSFGVVDGESLRDLKTEETRFGLVYPPVEDIAEAIARRDNAQVIPTGATAQNILGLSTQVPMNAVFLTSGSARIIKLGNRTITFRRAVPKNFAVKGRYTSLIVQALKSIGEENFSGEDLIHLQDIILRHPEPDTIDQDLAVMPSWIRKIFVRTLKTGKQKY